MEAGTKEYRNIHKWIQNNYGKACKCTSENCTGESIYFEWALRKGFEYKKDVTHFKELCASCHRSYDRSDEHNRKISESMIGKKPTSEHRLKLSEAHKGKKKSAETRRRMSEAKKIYWEEKRNCK